MYNCVPERIYLASSVPADFCQHLFRDIYKINKNLPCSVLHPDPEFVTSSDLDPDLGSDQNNSVFSLTIT
jgi:hypothetical protein